MLSTKTKYALKALLLLADREGQGPVRIADLAASERIPKKFLEQILLELKHQGILQSKMGKGGGYSLARPPKAITLGQVVRLFDGSLAPISCVSHMAYARCRDCKDERTCGIRQVMKEVRDNTARILDGTTLLDVRRKMRLLSASRR